MLERRRSSSTAAVASDVGNAPLLSTERSALMQNSNASAYDSGNGSNSNSRISIAVQQQQQETCMVPATTQYNADHRSPTPSSGSSCNSSAMTPASRSQSLNLEQMHDKSPQQQHKDDDPTLKAAEQAVSARLLPPLLLLVMVSYIDRTNLSFASIQLSHDLQLSSTMYGVGSGVFFLAYALGQIPSNLLLMHFGGPVWLSCITIAWGAAAAAFALVRGPVSFVVLRLLLGLAESGSLPGTWYYVTLFYPANKTTVPYSLIETGITVSQVIAAPFAAALLLLDGAAGLRGWQWLFLIEGLPALLLGCFIRFWLPSSINNARFLSTTQKEALSKAVAAAAAASDDSKDSSSLDSPNTALLPAAVERHGSSSSSGKLSNALVSSPSASSMQCSSNACPPAGPAAAAANASDAMHSYEQQSLLSPDHHSSSNAADILITVDASPTAAAAVTTSSISSKQHGSIQGSKHYSSSSSSDCGRSNWQKFVAVARNKVVLYAGCWRILHDIPGNGILYWTPMMVQALLVAAGSSAAAAAARHPGSGSSRTSSTGAYVVLLSAIPYAAASLFHLLNAWHSQRSAERKWHIGLTWLIGAIALLLLPAAAAGGLAAAAATDGPATPQPGISTAASIAAFMLLTIAHIGINGANGIQTGLVAGSIVRNDKALGLALYNMIGNIGSFLGPVMIGILHDATGGYVVAMIVLGFSLVGAAGMVVGFRPEKLDRRLCHGPLVLR